MKFYRFGTTLTFGKFKGKRLREIVKIEPKYIDWCVINLAHFYISEEEITRLQKENPNFSFTQEAKKALISKKNNILKKQDTKFNDDPLMAMEGPPTFDDWLDEEFGDDADIVRWNLD